MTHSIRKMHPSRRIFLQQAGLIAAALPLANLPGLSAADAPKVPPVLPNNKPETVLTDKRVKLKFGEERMILHDGLQPTLLCTKTGALVVQSQLSRKPHPQKRIFYPYALETVVSRDGGKSWTELPLKPGDNGVNIEGGIIQLRDGTILALETYVTPGDGPDKGIGLLYQSNDDYQTLQGPIECTIHLPQANFHGSSDDGGRPHEAMRLHRRIVEMPNGDLLTTLYGWMQGDDTPSGYTPTMRKTRVMLLRSKNKGRHWEFISTVAADSSVGTEGFGEAVLVRVSKGPHAGRLICQMRTGRDLYEAKSDDEGRTWTKASPRVYANLDVYRTAEWAEMFKDVKRGGKLVSENPNEYIAAVVDPDLIELRSGVLVAAFGLRIPARANFAKPTHPWNGNYLAFSLDQGETWSHVERLTTGVSTTHYMGIEELPQDNHLFVTYDFGHWTSKAGRYTYGRPLELSVTRG